MLTDTMAKGKGWTDQRSKDGAHIVVYSISLTQPSPTRMCYPDQ